MTNQSAGPKVEKDALDRENYYRDLKDYLKSRSM